MMSLWALVAGSRGEKPMASRLVLRPVLQAVGELYPGVVEGMEQAAVRKADEAAVNRRRLLAPWSRGITDLLALLVGTGTSHSRHSAVNVRDIERPYRGYWLERAIDQIKDGP